MNNYFDSMVLILIAFMLIIGYNVMQLGKESFTKGINTNDTKVNIMYRAIKG